jgi:hypothetical protein
MSFLAALMAEQAQLVAAAGNTLMPPLEWAEAESRLVGYPSQPSSPAGFEATTLACTAPCATEDDIVSNSAVAAAQRRGSLAITADAAAAAAQAQAEADEAILADMDAIARAHYPHPPPPYHEVLRARAVAAERELAQAELRAHADAERAAAAQVTAAAEAQAEMDMMLAVTVARLRGGFALSDAQRAQIRLIARLASATATPPLNPYTLTGGGNAPQGSVASMTLL